MSKKTLYSINNEIKVYINEASGISNRCKQKLISLVEKNFYVDLPNDNYLNIDIKILENGNIIMRDDEYKTTKAINNIDELFDRYDTFKDEVESLLSKNEINFTAKRKQSELMNLLIILFAVIISIAVISYGIKRLVYGDILGVIWLMFIISYYIIPATGSKMRNRLIRAKKFITKKFTKK